jgi:antitoxin (DNA-binding transcriptional repressor) of toxin-antitoxin stability system
VTGRASQGGPVGGAEGAPARDQPGTVGGGGYAACMSELPVDISPGVAEAADEAARGEVVYLTKNGQRLAAIVPAEFAAVLEGITPGEVREVLEDLAGPAAARQAPAEPAGSVSWEQVEAWL